MPLTESVHGPCGRGCEYAVYLQSVELTYPDNSCPVLCCLHLLVRIFVQELTHNITSAKTSPADVWEWPLFAAGRVWTESSKLLLFFEVFDLRYTRVFLFFYMYIMYHVFLISHFFMSGSSENCDKRCFLWHVDINSAACG